MTIQYYQQSFLEEQQHSSLLQWAPLNGITLGPRQTDPINRMIPLTDTHFSINSKQAMEIFKKMIPLTE